MPSGRVGDASHDGVDAARQGEGANGLRRQQRIVLGGDLFEACLLTAEPARLLAQECVLALETLGVGDAVFELPQDGGKSALEPFGDDGVAELEFVLGLV